MLEKVIALKLISENEKSEITQKLFIKVFKSNKQNYFQTKQMLSRCIIDTKTSALSGWVLLGLHLNHVDNPDVLICHLIDGKK
jgi:hypothetical protein